MKYKFHKEEGILECFVYSIKHSELEKARKKREQNERLGIETSFNEYDEEEKLYGEPIEIVLNLNAFGGIGYFTPNKVEMYEENNFHDGVYLEFIHDIDFVILMSFKEFKEIYLDFIKPKQEKQSWFKRIFK